MKLYYSKILWQRESSLDILFKFTLFLLSPILGLISSFFCIKTKSSFLILFLCALVYGYSMVVESSFYAEDIAYYLDGAHHRADFERIINLSYHDFIKQLTHPMDYGIRDFYDFTLKFIVSRISSNYHVFFCSVAFFFSFFALRSFKFFVRELPTNMTLISFILMCLFLNIQIFQINGVRFYTAAWIAIYSSLQIFINKNNRYYILLIACPLVHSAFYIYLLLIMIKKFFGKWDKFWMVTLLISIFSSELFSMFLVSNIKFLPKMYFEWGEYYINQDMVYGQGGRFYDLFGLLSRYTIYLLVFLMSMKSNVIINNEKTRDVFRFLMILVVFSSFAHSVSNLGGRFLVLSYPLIAYVYIVHYEYILRSYGGMIFYVIPITFSYSFFYYMPSLYLKVLEPCFFYASPLYLFDRYILCFVK